MKDEIKEITLKDLLPNEFYINKNKQMVAEITIEKLNIISDILTNLQEENERLKEELQQEKKDFKETNDYCFELKDYKSRNEKAIEYIEPFIEIDECIINGRMLKPLLNILQGSDKE